jgi:hypothetical protein
MREKTVGTIIGFGLDAGFWILDSRFVRTHNKPIVASRLDKRFQHLASSIQHRVFNSRKVIINHKARLNAGTLRNYDKTTRH